MKIFTASVNSSLQEKTHEEISVLLRADGTLSVCFKVLMFGTLVSGVYSPAVCVSSVMNYMLNNASASVCVCQDYLTVHTPIPFMDMTMQLCVTIV